MKLFNKLMLAIGGLFIYLNGLLANSPYYTLTQPNGVKFQAREIGYCCALCWQETPEGYIVVRGPDKYYHYAVSHPTKIFSASGLRVGMDTPKNAIRDIKNNPEILQKIEAEAERINAAIRKNRQRFLELQGKVPGNSSSNNGGLKKTLQTTIDMGIILVEYDDLRHYTPAYLISHFENMAFSEDTYIGFDQHPENAQVFGSIRDYYEVQSSGEIIITGEVINPVVNDELIWVRLGNSTGYSGEWAPDDVVEDAINAVIDSIANSANWTGLTANYQITMIIEAGTNGDLHRVGVCWPQGNLSANNFDPSFDFANWYGAIVWHERQGNRQGDPDYYFTGIGIWCHELGHMFGLEITANGIGGHPSVDNQDWTVMRSGARTGPLRRSNCPGNFDPPALISFDWVTPTIINDVMLNEPIEYVNNKTAQKDFYQYNVPSSNRMFIIENRQYEDFNQYMPEWWETSQQRGGLLFWDWDAPWSSNRIIRPADNDFDYVTTPYWSLGDGGDPFPGFSDNQSISMVTTPNTNVGSTHTGFAIINISDSDANMTADLYPNAWIGEISQNVTWSASRNPYYIIGDVTITTGYTLTINSGTTIISNGNTQLTINGTIHADGATFTSSAGNGAGDWNGIVLDNTADGSYIRNCTVENAVYGIRCIDVSSNVTIEKNRIEHNSYGIRCEQSHPYIYDNYIINNSVYGIYCVQSSSPYIRHNQLEGNFVGLVCMNTSAPLLVGTSPSDPYGANEIISNSNDGMRLYSGSLPDVGTIPFSHWANGRNNIFNNNRYQVFNYITQTMYARYNYWGNDPQYLYYRPEYIEHTPDLTSANANAGPSWSLSKSIVSTYILHSDTMIALIEQGLAAEGKGDYQSAIAAYRAIVEKYPDGDDADWALSRLMSCRAKQQRLATEVEWLQQLWTTAMNRSLTDMAALWLLQAKAKQGSRHALESVWTSIRPQNEQTELYRDALAQLCLISLYDFRDETMAEEYLHTLTAVCQNDPIVSELELLIKDWDGLMKQNQPQPNSETIRPTAIALINNYPNPFNPETTIQYALPQAGDVSIKVFNIRGKEVSTLVEGMKEAGTYTAVWSGTNRDGVAVASGMYIVKMIFTSEETGIQKVLTGKMTLLR